MCSLLAQAHRKLKLNKQTKNKKCSYCENVQGLQALYGVFWGFSVGVYVFLFLINEQLLFRFFL